MSSTLRPSVISGPASSSPDRNWLEMWPLTLTGPPRIGPRTVAGRKPSAETSAPRSRRASSTGPNGRARNCAEPSTTVRPGRAAATGRTNRAVVPDWRASTAASGVPARRSAPVTVTSAAAGSASTVAPSAVTAPSIARVSSANRTPLSVDVPGARAAQSNARLVMLFEPGGRTTASRGPREGVTVSTSGKSGTVPDSARNVSSPGAGRRRTTRSGPVRGRRRRPGRRRRR